MFEEKEMLSYTFTQIIGCEYSLSFQLMLIFLLWEKKKPREKKEKKEKKNWNCLSVCVCARVIDEMHTETETKLIKYLPPTTDENDE